LKGENSLWETLKAIPKVMGDVYIVIYYFNYVHIYTKPLNLLLYLIIYYELVAIFPYLVIIFSYNLHAGDDI
jgi:hypothetical protein